MSPGSNTTLWPLSIWLSVFSLTFGSFALISSELLPMAVLTPMAADLGVSEGAAGPAVTFTALFAGIAAHHESHRRFGQSTRGRTSFSPKLLQPHKDHPDPV